MATLEERAIKYVRIVYEVPNSVGRVSRELQRIKAVMSSEQHPRSGNQAPQSVSQPWQAAAECPSLNL